MPNQVSMVCPVCRAKQELQPVCRRCSADLALYLKALRSADTARQQYLDAFQIGDRTRAERTLRYLKWLRPTTASGIASS